MIKVGIVADHAIVRSGLKQFFSEQVDLRVVGEAASGREAIDLVRTTEMDVLVMNSFVLRKADQPALKNDVDWKNQFELD